VTGARKPRRAPGASESAIQIAIIDRLRWLGILAVSVPNEAKRSVTTAAALKARGMRAGFPDLICMAHGRVAFLEVKTATGRLSEHQRLMHDLLRWHGMFVTVVRSQDEAVAALRGAGFT
jgi:hypothetical protein